MTPREQLAAWDAAVKAWRECGEPEFLSSVCWRREWSFFNRCLALDWNYPSAVGRGR